MMLRLDSFFSDENRAVRSGEGEGVYEMSGVLVFMMEMPDSMSRTLCRI